MRVRDRLGSRKVGRQPSGDSCGRKKDGLYLSKKKKKVLGVPWMLGKLPATILGGFELGKTPTPLRRKKKIETVTAGRLIRS